MGEDVNALPEGARAIKDVWQRFFDTVAAPRECIFCPLGHVVFNGVAERSASVLLAGLVVYVGSVLCRRVRCQECRVSWRLYPPGLMPRRHFQACVVAQATSQHLFEADSTQEAVAAAHRCSRRTVSRWLGWVSALASPAQLLAEIVARIDAPVLPGARAVADLSRKGRDAAHRAILEKAAEVTVHLEALAMAMRLPPPGLQSVMEPVLAAAPRLSTYARPFIPDFARILGKENPSPWPHDRNPAPG